MNRTALAGVGLLLTIAPLHGDTTTAPTSNPGSTEAPATRDAIQTTRLTDFSNDDSNGRWRMVNDNVMGGRSKGGVRFADGVMTFFGEINTNGGGFASVRLPVERGTLAGAKQIELRLKHDGRTPYRLLVIDSTGRRREMLHQREFAFDKPAGEWQIVTIDLDKLQPTVRGEPINAAPLDPADAVQIGFILNDTGDGPFALQVDWIDVVR